MTKTGSKQFEIECPSRIWKFRAKSEFSRDSWWESIYKTWKGMDHKEEMNMDVNAQNAKREAVANSVPKPEANGKPPQYGYNGYNYNYSQKENVDLQYEEGQSKNANNHAYPDLHHKQSKKQEAAVDSLWDDKPNEEGDMNEPDEVEPGNEQNKPTLQQHGEPGANDSTYGLLSSVPDAPDGFVFHRISPGDTLVSLSVKYGVSQNKIKQYNNDMSVFGHRLAHISGKLILIPIAPNVVLTEEVKKQIDSIYREDNKYNLAELDEKEYDEPDENGKYTLCKALMYHAKGLDEYRAQYYLGAAKWNVRKALKLWKVDDIWEKQQRVMKECEIDAEEAVILLENFHWNADEAITQRKKHGNKLVLQNINRYKQKNVPLLDMNGSDNKSNQHTFM
eukprot:CAMPEP_0197040118 /NCGR_PEP_ID=MMETSP1384-20130603/16859_1 /TAXON_ID=29189 /ORGANISM="Ammonia sp." /LENGTH=391 /DNA_ID=CAMNT_0042470815 /DNA_START=144 /DNA_END=1319 /DNA_ORIENTATION=-